MRETRLTPIFHPSPSSFVGNILPKSGSRRKRGKKYTRSPSSIIHSEGEMIGRDCWRERGNELFYPKSGLYWLSERGAFFLPANQSLFARVSRGGLRLLFLFANQRREENTPTTKIVKNNLPKPCRSRSPDDRVVSRGAVYRPLGVVYGLAATPQEGLMKAAISTDILDAAVRHCGQKKDRTI